MKNMNAKDTKRMTKAEVKKLKSKTNWAKLVSEDKKEKSNQAKNKPR